ncbi:cationic peroxidase 1-like [Lolium rigidum]|uniref:cationic peroxidase 1-like n=1 Tax=Lolium rigidum TaxID=89674 RepID=UPI001F5CDCE2|nr:cationic peroxidase 1-like [Lolium rigidum]
MATKLSTRAILLSLFLGLAVFAGKPVATHGGGTKDAVADNVRKIVATAIQDNPGVGPALIRLLFHDCWVQGCDGSVLLDGSKTEKAAKNNIGLDGFAVIDEIKAKVGEDVSCADIVILAARDATFIVSRGKIDYNVTMGRMDGVKSSAAAADAVLPPSTFNITQLKANFAAKGFNTRELVALSGAHAVGVAHRSSFQDRLDNATATPIVPKYSKALTDDVEKQKKLQGTQDPIEPNNIRDKELAFRNASGYDDTGVDTSKAARGVLDNSYYHANLQNKVLFRSDWELRNDTTGVAGGVMATFEANANKWFLQFGNAMAKLSKLPADGTRFEIRKNCRKNN